MYCYSLQLVGKTLQSTVAETGDDGERIRRNTYK